MDLKRSSLESLENLRELLCSLSDSIWDHPETGYHEHFALNACKTVLEQQGFQTETGIAGIETALSASFGSGKPVIGFLGEYDALPNLSQKSCLVQKEPQVSGGAGHGCGHNLLGTGSLAAALAVKEYLVQSKMSGTVKFFGCPAEEGGAGKGFMAKAGVFDDLDAAFTWHPGEVNSAATESTMANYQICYHFYGTSAHAAMSPEMGRSALDALELMNTGVQYLREHIPLTTRVHYAITNSGGNSPGIVQPYAEGLYLMRAPELNQVKELYERVNRIAKGAAMMTDTTVEIEFIKACSNTVLNSELLHVMQKNMEEIPLPDFSEEDFTLAKEFLSTQIGNSSYFNQLAADVTDPEELARLEQNRESPIHNIVMPYPPERQGFVSSDVGDVSWVCPVAQVNICTLPSRTTLHSWQAVALGKSELAKKGMLYAGKVLAGSAIDVLNNPSILERAKAEKERRTAHQAFVSPIPDGVKPRIF